MSGRRRVGGARSRHAASESRREPNGSRKSTLHRSTYENLSSLLRRNEHMLLVEQRYLDQQLADRDACEASYWDLVLYEVFGCQSQRRRQQTAAFRQRRRHLTQLHLLLGRARGALDNGNLELADKILRRVSPQLGIVPDPTETDVECLPVLGDPDVDVADPGDEPR